MQSIRLLIADDDPMVRHALEVFLRNHPHMRVVMQASDGSQAVEAVAATRPDVALIDVRMPHMGGVRATEIISAAHPDTKVLAMTAYGVRHAIVPMLQAGAVGFVHKSSGPDHIVTAITHAHNGHCVLSPGIAAQLVAAVRDIGSTEIEPLCGAEMPSEREMQVLEQLALGHSNLEIAQLLHLSEGTIKAHLGRVIAKWGVRDRVQVLIRAVRAGLVTLG